MSGNTRTKNSVRNSIVGVSAYIMEILCKFIVRTFFVNLMASEYWGMDTIFSNILHFLSLAELGIGNAVVYSLYKPLAEKDDKKIAELMKFFKYAYMIIAIAVAVIGVIIMPFINFIITDAPMISENLYVMYLMYLANSVCSYLLIYRKTLLVADQKEYKTSIVNICGVVSSSILQIVFLVLTRKFVIYLLIQIMFTILQNLVISKVCLKQYPILKQKADFPPKEECKGILKNVKALAIYKVAVVIVHNTDNLIISRFVGLVAVGLYSNYYYITSAVYNLVKMALSALTASIGNLNVNADAEKKELVYRTVTFISFWMFSFVAIGFYVMLDDVISVWVGSEYILDRRIVIVLIINFFIEGVSAIFSIMRGTHGLFVEGQIRPIISSLVNLVVSIVLVNFWGMLGVFIGTTISFLSMNIWYDTYIVYKYKFQKSVFSIYKRELIYTAIAVVIAIALRAITVNIGFDDIILTLAVKFILCTLVVNLLYLMIYRKTEEFQYVFKNLRKLIK